MAKETPLEEKRKIILEICARHAEGDTIREIFKSYKGISRATFYIWLEKDTPELIDHYQRARESWADQLHDKKLEIAEKAKTHTYVDREGNIRVDTGAVLAARLEIDSIEWTLGRAHAKKYGAKQEEQHGEKPIPRTVIQGAPKLDEPLK